MIYFNIKIRRMYYENEKKKAQRGTYGGVL